MMVWIYYGSHLYAVVSGSHNTSMKYGGSIMEVMKESFLKWASCLHEKLPNSDNVSQEVLTLPPLV